MYLQRQDYALIVLQLCLFRDIRQTPAMISHQSDVCGMVLYILSWCSFFQCPSIYVDVSSTSYAEKNISSD